VLRKENTDSGLRGRIHRTRDVSDYRYPFF
jgi:hypothetical protein